VDSLLRELARVAEGVAGVEQQKVELVDTSSKLAVGGSELGYSETLLEKNKRLREIEKNIADFGKKYEEVDALIRGIESLQKQVQDAKSTLQTISGFSDGPTVLQVKNQLVELEANRKGIGDDLPKRRHALENAEVDFRRNRLLTGLASKTGLILGTLVSVAGFVGMFFNTASLAAAIIGLVFLIGAMWARSHLAQPKARICELHERIKQMEEALKETEKHQRDILSRVNCSSLEEFTQKDERRAKLLEQETSSHNQLVGKLGARTLEDIEDERRKVARTLAEERERLTDDLESTRLSPEEYVKLEKKVEDLRGEKSLLGRREIQCQAGISSAKSDPEDQARLEESLKGLQNALEREQRRVRVYRLARDFVSSARSEVLVSANDALQAQIQKTFRVFTNDKYQKVMLGEGSMDFNIYSEEKEGWVRPDELSAGVIDEFYLACRLALVRLIYGETQPPLILDDPFANFDEPRLARTLDFLGKLSKEHQIIVFTLGDAYDGIADRMIHLE